MQNADLYLGAYPEPARRQRRLRELGGLIAAVIEANGPAATVEALVALAAWVRTADRRMPLPDAAEAQSPPPSHRRLFALVLVLEDPTAARALREKLTRFLSDADGIKLLAEAGLPSDRGLVQETTDRLFRRLLPAPRDDKDLSVLLLRVLPRKADLAFLEATPPELFARVCAALGAGEPGSPWEALYNAARDALVLLTARVQGLGLGEGIRVRARLGPVAQSPFYQLPRAADAFLAAATPEARVTAERAFRQAIAGCRDELALVLARLETAGVSLDVVYTIEVIERVLARSESLVTVLAAPAGRERFAASFGLLVPLARGKVADRSLRALAYTNLHLLARKLVERAGKTGEHYITTTRREYYGLLARAAGGGLLTAGTAAVKLALGNVGLPYFIAGLVAGLNYSVSFILIQLCGFTLATKQPSMTAAALAGALGAGGQRLGELVTQTARLVRSQLAAALGNVTLVTAGALVIDQTWRLRTGHSMLDDAAAAGVIASLHPTRSGTVFYAALTGVILWTASLVGGWVENFAVCHRLPQAIAEHRAGRIFGRRALRFASEFLERNISGLGTSVALGFMLGMTPYLGKFFGLPLDVRHVTLATGQLAFAVSHGGPYGLSPREVGLALVGIALTFILNLGTSFFLALTVALRAREIRRRDRWVLLSVILRRFLRHPLEFLLPPPK